MKYGWRPDPPDIRDYKAERIQAFHLFKPLPSLVDLTGFCSPVENQGNIGSCTGNAIVGALEYLCNKTTGRFADLSRLFVYYNERMIEGTISEDAGACIRDGIKSLVKWGVCTEDLWPYVEREYEHKPSREAYDDALTRRITIYARVRQNIHSIKAVLADGFPIIFGFTVYDRFESDEVACTGRLEIPKSGEKPLGGHAVLAVGYNDQLERILVRNSWGAEWGKDGYFTMPYDYITNDDLACDFWVVKCALQ